MAQHTTQSKGQQNIFRKENSSIDLDKMDKMFADIHADILHANTRKAFMDLYRRASSAVALTYAPSWEIRFGKAVNVMRQQAKEEFRKAVHKINQRAERIGTDADYLEQWSRR